MSNFRDKCLLRNFHIPLIPCEEKRCQWYVKEDSYNNCFWVLSNALLEYPRELDLEEIAEMEELSIEEVEEIIEEALTKLRNCVRKRLGDL